MNYSAGKPIGPTFSGEIASLADRRFAWGPDGNFSIDDQMPPAGVSALKAVIAAHDPSKPLGARPTLSGAVSVDDVLRWALDRVNEVRAGLPAPLPAIDVADARGAIEQLAKRKER